MVEQWYPDSQQFEIEDLYALTGSEMTYEKDIQTIADHVGADAGALRRVIESTGAYGDLQPLDIVDDRPYHHFEVGPADGSTFFTCLLHAYTIDNDELFLPTTIKNAYRHKEAANDVASLCRQLFIGKNKQEVEKMLGLENMT